MYKSDILTESVKFRPVNTTFQKKLNRDAKRIKNEKNILVPADKTNNYYTVTPQQYKKLMKDNVTAAYTRSDKHVMDKINQEAQTIANTLELADRIDFIAEKAAYITLKDHKDNFRNNPTCRLINTTKSEIGKIAKQTLDRINRELLKATNGNQWENSDAVIKWFNTIKRKPNDTFITFDVVNFYPSITEQLLLKALDFAKTFTNITDLERKIITQAKHTILYHDNTPWIKTNSQDMFDVTMGSFDGAETCELVGTYILNIISSVIPKENIGLYRDDGLATICQPAPVVEHIQKKLRKEFSQLGLNITVQAHITTTDFLDITFDLAKKEYQPYTKPGNSHLYVHTESNHPPTITNRIPKSIEARLSNISNNEAIFNKAKPAYEKALRTADTEPP